MKNKIVKELFDGLTTRKPANDNTGITMPESPEKSSNNFGTIMTVLTFVTALGLLGFIFDDILLSQINPNRSPESRMENGQATVILQQARGGHYVTSGKINGQEVFFIVDTGASNVSVPESVASELGLNRGASGRAHTANGTVTVYRTKIPELRIGDIRLYDVEGSINPGMEGDGILLGMSVLKQLEFTQRGDTLILKTL